MKKIILMLLALFLWNMPLSHANTQVPASQISVTTGTFTHCLTSGATNAQLALNAIDVCLGSGGGMVWPTVPGIMNWVSGTSWGTPYSVSGSGMTLAATVSPIFVTPTLGVATATSWRTTGTIAGSMSWYQPSANGANYVGFQAPATIPTSVMWVLPAADGVGCFQSNGAGQMSIGACGSGGGGSGTVTLGTQYQLGFYGTNGTIISGSSNITTDAAGDLTVIGALVSGGTGQSTVGYGLVVNTLGSSTANGGDFLYKNASGVTIFSIGATNGLLTVPITGGGVQCLEVSNTGVVSGTSCSGGSMIYPVGSGIPVVVSGTSWGTTVAAPAGLILGTTDTQVVTNKKIHPKALAVTQSATPAMNTDNGTVFEITGLAQAITSMTSGLSGTPIADDIIEIEFTDNGTGRAITWGTSFVASTQALPTTTVASIMLSVYFQWNGVTSKWVCKGVA